LSRSTGARTWTCTSRSAEIRRAIADGEAKPGERLPHARDLAAVLGVNNNTVLRALREVRDKGLLEFRRGRSITVAGTPDRGAVVAHATDLVRHARRYGYRRTSSSRSSRTSPETRETRRRGSVSCGSLCGSTTGGVGKVVAP
jgi:GntR family transcriptional regulator